MLVFENILVYQIAKEISGWILKTQWLKTAKCFIFTDVCLFLIPAWLLSFPFCDNILKCISTFTKHNNKQDILGLGFYLLTSHYCKMAISTEYDVILLKMSNFQVACLVWKHRKVCHLQILCLGWIKHWEAQEVVNASNVIFRI